MYLYNYIRCHGLTDQQLRVVHYILGPHPAHNPPLVVYGPFGTGKTETLAQATLALLHAKPDSKVLICTFSNRYM